jgi:hypothetical protein
MAATAYHINARGEAAVCRASHGRCPFGSADEHHSSAEAARDAFEHKHQDAVVTPVARKRPAPYSTGRSAAATVASAALSTASQALSYGTPEARDRFASTYYRTSPRVQDRVRPSADAPVRKLVLD